jgi:hypothetical protein
VGKVYRIGILEPIPAAQNAANLNALRKGLRDLGYVEGRSLIIEAAHSNCSPTACRRACRWAGRLTQMHQQTIVDLVARNRLPAIYPAREFVEAGGLIAYAVNYPDLYLQFASLVDKIFKGDNPGDVPVEQPTKFELVINRSTAAALGIAVPQSLLLCADEVIG